MFRLAGFAVERIAETNVDDLAKVDNAITVAESIALITDLAISKLDQAYDLLCKEGA